MSKKLYVPDHVAEKAIKAGFRDNQPKSKNEDDPSEMETSTLERLLPSESINISVVFTDFTLATPFEFNDRLGLYPKNLANRNTDSLEVAVSIKFSREEKSILNARLCPKYAIRSIKLTNSED